VIDITGRETSLPDHIADCRWQSAGNAVAYGIGCAWLGRKMEDQAQAKADVATLLAAYERGFRYYDTANAYCESERVVGAFVKEVPRDTIFVATKSRLPRDTSPQQAAAALADNLERSLVRLQTDRIDLFQIHDVDAFAPLVTDGGAVDTLLRFQSEGVIRHIGLATRQHGLLEQAVRDGRFASILTYSDYTPINRSAEAVIRAANDRRVAAINGSPLCLGWLSGADPRTRQARSPEERQRQDRAVLFYDYCLEQGVSVLAAALQYPLRNRSIAITLTGPASPDEVAASAAALGEPIPDAFWSEWETRVAQEKG